ncbi:Uncharacterised protein [Chryseobacterium nakagawai]|nr:Uncharacterised protein [Chryseobacterium nakagawai]
MAKNYFLNVLAGITPFGMLVSLHTVRDYQSPHHMVITGLRI